MPCTNTCSGLFMIIPMWLRAHSSQPMPDRTPSLLSVLSPGGSPKPAGLSDDHIVIYYRRQCGQSIICSLRSFARFHESTLAGDGIAMCRGLPYPKHPYHTDCFNSCQQYYSMVIRLNCRDGSRTRRDEFMRLIGNRFSLPK